MVDVGSGPPLVLIPGIQGRYEWMQPAIQALSREFRVIAGSLPGERGAMPTNGHHGFDGFVDYVDALLDAKKIPDAVICGISFGGLIALRYAARRPERVRALILASTPGPNWKPDPYQERYMKRPIVSAPFFAVRAISHLWRELRVTYPGLLSRLRFCTIAGARILGAPAAPRRIGSRAQLAIAERFDLDCASIKAPTLVVTGEGDLDRVVSQADSLGYVTAIDGARFHLFDKTGHLGTISAPERFTAIVSNFLNG
jgi:pimeloyl-ACP methyl ester carboxylesterase